MGATVVPGVRSLERGEAAAKDIRKSLHNEKGACGNIVVLKGDLADVVDVARFANAFIQTFNGRLDYLILNAVLAGFHKRRSAQGLDLVMGINFLGHFALAKALLPSLEATAREFYKPSDIFQPRVCSLSSTLHQWSREDPSETLHVMPRDADLTLPLPRDATTLLEHFCGDDVFGARFLHGLEVGPASLYSRA